MGLLCLDIQFGRVRHGKVEKRWGRVKLKFESTFSAPSLKTIYGIILNRSIQTADGTWQLTVSDAKMSEILGRGDHGGVSYNVSASFVRRARKKLGIKPCGTRRKYSEDDLKKIQSLICDHAVLDKDNSWRLTISDAEMCNIINSHGITVNLTYVERTRRGLGITPLGERGGARPGAGRPSMGNFTRDPEYAKVIHMHNSAVAQLSYRRPPSGALRGQSGVDVHDRFGYHTTDMAACMERKRKKLNSVYKEGSFYDSKVYNTQEQDVHDDLDDTVSIFDEEIYSKASLYGKVGKGGGINSINYSQAFLARCGQ